MKNEDQDNGSSDERTTPSKRVSERRLARTKATVKLKPSDSAPSSLCSPATTYTNVSSPSSSASKTGFFPAMTSRPNCSRAPRTHSTPSFCAASKMGTRTALRVTTLSVVSSSISSSPSSALPTGSTKADVSPSSSFLWN